MSKRTKIFVQDESIVNSDGKMIKKYWCNEDERPIYRWKGDHRKFIAYGMISISGERFFRSYDKFDGPTFLRYVKDAVAKYGRIMIIADRASQHRTKDLERYVQENQDKIRIEYLPKASPQHNVMETIWFVAKQAMDHSEYYPQLEDKRSNFMKYLRTKKLPNNVTDYFGSVHEYENSSIIPTHLPAIPSKLTISKSLKPSKCTNLDF
ncbi:MAG: Transposase [Cenarchaeum symbiont of Oopsacas minuta]|nr:Transposase [Cenarchaeum symbiont of Oopsacas minuta]